MTTRHSKSTIVGQALRLPLFIILATASLAPQSFAKPITLNLTPAVLTNRTVPNSQPLDYLYFWQGQFYGVKTNATWQMSVDNGTNWFVIGHTSRPKNTYQELYVEPGNPQAPRRYRAILQ